MKKIRILAFVLVVLVLMSCLASCSDMSEKDSLETVEYKTYDIIFELNGGVMSEDTVQNYEGGKVHELPKPTKTGFEFLGWYTSPDFSGSVVSYINPQQSMVLYAKWKDEKNILNNIWKKELMGVDYTDASIPTDGLEIQVEIPAALKEYADNGSLRIKVTATFTVGVRTKGTATSTANAYLKINGEKCGTPSSVTASATGGGYSSMDVVGAFPKDGEVVKKQGTITATYTVKSSTDLITFNCAYDMKSNRKSAMVTTDLHYSCNSLEYEFYVE